MKDYPKYIYVESEIIKALAGMPKLIQQLRNNEGLYLYNLIMLSALYCENKRLLRPLTQIELIATFPTFKPTFKRTLDLLLSKGLIENQNNPSEGKRGKRTKFKLVYTLKGEMLLKKYEKLLGEITEGY
jgi:DNA-binding MarR family transcriptional regulator